MRYLQPIAATVGILLSLSSAAALAEGDPIWIRHAAISPNGETVAFTYRGQIYVVDADEGGLATPVTSQGTHSYGAVWRPDSKELAFASDANGDDDVYVTDFKGGSVKRLTWSSTDEVPTSFSPDGASVLFTKRGLGDAMASLQAPLSGLPQLYAVHTADGRQQLVLPNAAEEAVWSADGTKLLYTYNPSVDPGARQHRVASNARQIWVFDRETGQYARLTDSATDELEPAWGPGGRSVYYLGEASGRLNVWTRDLATGASRQVTRHEDYPVRHLSVSAGGDIAYVHNGALYHMAAGDDGPRRLSVIIPEQRMEQSQRKLSFATSEFVSSPDGRLMAVVLDTDVFLIDRAGAYYRVTDSGGPEQHVAFSPDGSKLVYAALRNRDWGVYGVDLERAWDGASLIPSFEELPLVVQTGRNFFQPQISPDGTRLAYVADRREVEVLEFSTGRVVKLFRPQDHNTSYQDGDLWFSWSPASDQLLLNWRLVGGAEFAKAGVVPADGSAPIRTVSSAVTHLSGGKWNADGTQVVMVTPMFGPRQIDHNSSALDLYRVFMSDEARNAFLETAEGWAPPGGGQLGNDDAVPVSYAFQQGRNATLEGRLTPGSNNIVYYTPLDDGRHFLAAAVDMSMSLVVVAIDLYSGEIREITELEDAGGIEALSFSSAMDVLDVKTADGILSIAIHDPQSRQFVPVRIDYSIEPSERRNAAFDEAWADLKHRYYRSDIEGRDWDRIGANYRAFLGSIDSDRELVQLVEEMFGELSASHLFVAYAHVPDDALLATDTASLGVFVDYDDPGPGVRIAGTLKGGPMDRIALAVEPGDRIVSVNGKPVANTGALDRALNGMAGRAVAVGLLRNARDRVEEVPVRTIDLRQERELNRLRWVDDRRSLVAELSNGCIAYQHLAAMDTANFAAVYGRLLSERDTALAALVDVRSNGGGNLTSQLMTFLTGEPYARVGREDRVWAVEPLDRWTQPSAVLVDSFAYSDGSIFPQSYRDMGIGPLVGEPLLNTGTAVDYIRSKLVPELVYGIPVLPFRKLDGTLFENLEIVPDIEARFDPNAAAQGRDPQLEAAVAALTAEIGATKDCRE